MWACNLLSHIYIFHLPNVIQGKIAMTGKLPLFKERTVLDPTKLSPLSKEEASFSSREIFLCSVNWSLDGPIKG